MNELLRRAILVVFVSIAVGLAYYADLNEYFVLHQVTVSHLRTPSFGAWGMSDAEKARLKTLPLKELVRERENAPLLIIGGGQLDSFFGQAMAAFQGDGVPERWRQGAEISFGDLNALWLWPEQLPLDALAPGSFADNLDQVLLAGSESDTMLLRIRRNNIGIDDYAPFIGFSGAAPPFKMLYPYYFQAMLIALAGLLFYLFLPRKKPIPGALYTKRWQVMMIDAVALMLFLAFFMLGWFLAGPSSLGPNEGWFVAAVVWLFCLAGLYLFEQGTFYALFNMKAENDGLRIRTFQGELKIPYTDIEEVRGAILKNPRWLTILLTLASIFGRGSQRHLAGGQALIMGSASYPGMALKLKKSGTIYLWGSASGNTFTHMQRFHDGLLSAGVALDEEPIMVRGLGTEPRFDKVADMDCNWMLSHPFLVMIITPIVGTLGAYAIVQLF